VAPKPIHGQGVGLVENIPRLVVDQHGLAAGGAAVETDDAAHHLALGEGGRGEDGQAVLDLEGVELIGVLDERPPGVAAQAGRAAKLDVLLQPVEPLVAAHAGVAGLGEAEDDGAEGRVVLGVLGRVDELFDRAVAGVLVAAALPGLRDALAPALHQEGQVGVGPAEQQHLVLQGVSTGEHAQVLVHDGVGQGVHDLQAGDAALHEVDDVGLGEDSALGRHMVQLAVVKGDAAHLVLGHAHLDHALVVHRRHRVLVGLAVFALLGAEDDDLGVLAAQLDDRAHRGVEALDGQGDGVDLLDEAGAQRLGEGAAARARDEDANLLGLREAVADADEEFHRLFGLAGLVALVVAPQDLVGLGIADHRLDRGAADVEADGDDLVFQGHYAGEVDFIDALVEGLCGGVFGAAHRAPWPTDMSV